MKICNLSKEHIIPQSIGGRLKAYLFCKECNDVFGEVLDAEISESFGWIATILNINRERGTTQPFDVKEINTNAELTFNGKKLQRKKPIVKIQYKEDDKTTLDHADITARSKTELENIVKSIKGKYKIPDNGYISEENHAGPVDGKYTGVFDTTLIRRAVTKMVYSFLCYKIPINEGLSESFDAARAYIISGDGPDLASANFVHTQFMSDYTRPLHRLHISYDRNNRMVIGYVMIFGIYRYTILLSESYNYPLDWSCLDYTFNPVTAQAVMGKPFFRAPAISKEDILHPKQSKQFVLAELKRGFKILNDNTKEFDFLDIEFH